jgi:tetratricopeptide (TPR) repeat protein
MRWFLSFAETAAEELPRSRQLHWMDNLDLEYGNLRQALGFAVESGDAEVAQRLAAALWRYWEIRGLLAEGRQWMEAAIELPGPVPEPVGALVRKAAGNLARDQGDLAAAEEFYTAALAMYEEISDIGGVASVINNLGNVRLDAGDHEAAGMLYERSLAKFRAVEDPWNVALLLNNLALAVRMTSDLERAARLAKESADLFHKIGDRRGEGRALETLARVLDLRGEHRQAIRMHRRALKLRHEVGDLAGVARSLEGLARSNSGTGDLDLAARLLGQAERLREVTGEAFTHDDGVEHARTLETLRQGLAADAFSRALSEGRASELAEVIRALDLDP